MKVTVADFMNALSVFEAKWISSLQKRGNKFVAGIALSDFNKGVPAMLKEFTGEDGLVDCDAVKAKIDAGLNAADGMLVLEPQIDPKWKLVGIGIDDIRFSRADFDEFFNTTIAQFAKKADA